MSTKEEEAVCHWVIGGLKNSFKYDCSGRSWPKDFGTEFKFCPHCGGRIVIVSEPRS